MRLHFTGNDAARDALACRHAREDASRFAMVNGEPVLVEPATRRIVYVIE